MDFHLFSNSRKETALSNTIREIIKICDVSANRRELLLASLVSAFAIPKAHASPINPAETLVTEPDHISFKSWGNLPQHSGEMAKLSPTVESSDGSYELTLASIFPAGVFACALLRIQAIEHRPKERVFAIARVDNPASGYLQGFCNRHAFYRRRQSLFRPDLRRRRGSVTRQRIVNDNRRGAGHGAPMLRGARGELAHELVHRVLDRLATLVDDRLVAHPDSPQVPDEAG